MDYEEYAVFLFSCMETIFGFALRVLVAGVSLTLLAFVLKYTGRRPKKVVTVENSGNMNEYLDGFMKDAGIKIHKLHGDPLSLPDTKHDFQRKLLFFNTKGGLLTKRTKLKGLSSIHRAGDANLNMDSLTSLRVRVTLAVHNMNAASECAAWLGQRMVKFKLGANVRYLKGTAEIEIPLFSLEKPRATSLVIDDIGKISLDVKDLGPLNWIINSLSFLFLNLFKDMLKDLVAEPAQTAMNKAIADIKIPNLF